MARSQTQTRSRAARLRYLSVPAALAPAPAAAGAWIAPEGGQEIWTNVVGACDQMRFYETSAYWALPVGETNSFVAAPWLAQNFDTDDGSREAVRGFKATLRRGDGTAVALQAGALWISHTSLNACGEGGGEVRLIAGTSLPADGAFVNFELATPWARRRL